MLSIFESKEYSFDFNFAASKCFLEDFLGGGATKHWHMFLFCLDSY